MTISEFEKVVKKWSNLWETEHISENLNVTSSSSVKTELYVTTNSFDFAIVTVNKTSLTRNKL